MTVLVGVRCQDGVVIGADTAVTYGPIPDPAQATLEVPEGFKIAILCDSQVIVATTGETGLGQRFCKAVSDKFCSVQNAQRMPPITAMTELASKVRQDFDTTRSPWDRGWGLGALVGMPLANSPRLAYFDWQNFRPELVGETEGERFKTLPLVTMGGGQKLADPFLAHAHRVLFGEAYFPTVKDARLLVAWTLSHVVRFNTGGVGGGIDIAVLEQADGKWKASMYDQGEALQAVAAIETYIRDFPSALAKDQAGAIDIKEELKS